MPQLWRFYVLFLGLLTSLTLVQSAWSQGSGFLGKPVAKWAEDLTNHDAGVRRSAAFALGKSGALASSAVPKLIRALHDPHASVREAAAAALGEIGPVAWKETFASL